MDLESAQNNALAKLPLLKQGDYDIWRLRIESYIQLQDYALWEIIEDGNSFKPVARTTTNADGTSTSTIPGVVTNVAFVSTPSSTNDVNTSNVHVSTASSSLSTACTTDNTTRLSDAIIYAFLANQPNGSQVVHEDLEQIHEDDLEEMDLKNPRSQEYRSRNQDNSRKTVNVEESSSKAMLAIDGIQRIELNKSEFDLANYKRGLASVEEQLVFYKKNEGMLCDQIVVLKRDASFNESEINALKIHIERLMKEKESNQIKIDNFENASKSLDKLIGCQISDNNRKCVGYNVIAPPLIGLFAPPTIDLSNSGLEEFKQPEFKGYGVKVNKSVSENSSKEIKNTFGAPIIKDWVSDCDKDETLEKVSASANVQKPKQTDQPRNNSTNWNTPMSKKLGVGFQFTLKACFVCGSFNHLIKDCDFHDKKMVQKPVLNNVKKRTGQREARPVWNNAMRTNHQNFSNSRRNFAPTTVLTKSGLVPISTARQSSSRAAASVSTVRPIKTTAPKSLVNVAKTRPNAFQKLHSPSRRPFYQQTTLKNRNLNNKVNTVKVNSVNTDKGKRVTSAIGEQEINAVKSKACWVWRPKIKVGNEAVYKELGDRMERAATTASSFEAEQDSEGYTPGCDEGRKKLNELTELCTKLSEKVTSLEQDLKQTKQVYGKALTKLVKKVKHLEDQLKSTTKRRKSKVVILHEEEDLVSEDPSKQGRICFLRKEFQKTFKSYTRRSTDSLKVSTVEDLFLSTDEEIAQKVRDVTVAYQSFEDMVKGFEREDLVALWSLAKVAQVEKIVSFTHLSKQVLVEELKEKSISKGEILAVVEEEGNTLMTPIFEYLKEETMPADVKKARAVRRKSQRFAVINGTLYRKYFFGPWLRCVGLLQANYVLREIHEGSCNMHACKRSIMAKALRISYYWPTMHKDERALIRATEAVIPAEIGMPTLRTAEVDLVQNNEALEINLDLLEERREQAAIREAKSKARMEKYHNSKVKNTSFKPGDLVYRNNDASRTKDIGKLGPKWEGPYEVTEALGKGTYKLRDRYGKQLP
ncbi:hypothetical protein Tco_1385625 [Tanacetum coccineum]